MEFESKYEIDQTALYIYTHNFTRVALQFPDELLKDSTKVVRALREKLRALRKCDEGDESLAEKRTDAGLYVMADATYGSCCIDEVGAAHINADCVVHYGHTCLSQTSTLPAYFVFGKASVSISDCAEKICTLASSSGKPVLVLFGLEYAYAMHDLKEALTDEASTVSSISSKLDFCCADALPSAVKPSKGQKTSNGQGEDIAGISGQHQSDDSEARKTKYNIGGLTWSLPHDRKIEDYLAFWIGSDNSAFANAVLTFNGCEIVRYDATTKSLTTDVSQTTRILKRRYYLVEKAKDANVVGILVGTLGVAGYLHMIHQMKDLVTKAGKKAYLLVVGRPNPAKLANFPECDVFVYVSCAQTALFDSKEFLAPVITPFEAILAFRRESQWTGEYTMEFRDLINMPSSEAESDLAEPRYSFFEGGYVEELGLEENANDNEEGLALAIMTEKALRLRDEDRKTLAKTTPKSGAEFLAMRSYQGLEINYDGSTPKPLLIGRTGRAAGYEDEKCQKQDH